MNGSPLPLRALARCRAALAPLLGCTILAALVLAGCGGGGGSSSSGPGPHQSLDNITSGKTPPTSGNVGGVANQYKTLYQANPNNPDDATGYAISEAAFAGLQFDNAIGGPAPSVARGSRAAAAHAAAAARLSQFGQALMIWKVPSLLSSNGSLSWPTATDFLPGGAVPEVSSSLPTGPQVQAAMAQLDQSLASCETALDVPLSNPSYTYPIVVQSSTNPSQTQTVLLGQAEFNVLYTIIATLRGVINPFLAYNVSDPGYNLQEGLYTVDPTDMGTNGATIGPSVYMPASPFLTLKSGGAANMHTAQTELNTACTDGVDAINEVEARSNNNLYLLDPGTFVTQNELNNVKDQITTYQAYLNGNATIKVLDGDGNDVSTTIDLNAWFTTPPQDLKAFYPTYHVVTTVDAGSSTGYDTTLTLSGSDFPDLTFGGLFPDGFPLPQSESNNVIGPYDPTTSYFELQDVSGEALGWLSLDLNWYFWDFNAVYYTGLDRRPTGH